MKKFKEATVLLILLALLSPLAIAETVVSVSGTVNYPQHIALTSDAVLHVILSDVTSPGAPRAIGEI